MTSLEEAAAEFLKQRRIAVAGVSRKGDVPANMIFRKLRSGGYEVFPVNPHADEVEGERCYHDLSAIPGGVDAVVIATPPEAAEAIVRRCGELGIRRVWMHRSFGQGSMSEDAVRLCRELNIAVIPGSCPMMFLAPVDLPHRCLRWFLRVSGKAPSPIGCGH